jgi:hypothetical protein
MIYLCLLAPLYTHLTSHHPPPTGGLDAERDARTQLAEAEAAAHRAQMEGFEAMLSEAR